MGEDAVSLRGAIRPVKAEREEIKESSELGWTVLTTLFSMSDEHTVDAEQRRK